MARPVKKIDGRSKEARAKRAKTAAPKARPLSPPSVADWRKVSRKQQAAKTTTPRKSTKPEETALSFDRETSLRILALQIASNNIGRDTAPRDLVPLARQIEEFLTGATHDPLSAREARPLPFSSELSEGELEARGLRDAEAAFS